MKIVNGKQLNEMPTGTMYSKPESQALFIKINTQFEARQHENRQWWELDLRQQFEDYEDELSAKIGVELKPTFIMNDGEFYDNDEELYIVYTKEEMIDLSIEILKYANYNYENSKDKGVEF